MRVDAEKKCVVLEEWDKFKQYCYGKFTDIVFRHCYADRTDAFLKQAAEYAEDVMNDPALGNEVSLVSERSMRIPDAGDMVANGALGNGNALGTEVSPSKPNKIDNTYLTVNFFKRAGYLN